MFTRRLYYFLKPYLPWDVRMALRRIDARKRRKTHADVWPVNEAAARPPKNWPGWPGGKKFAFVLTHDVEGGAGLAKCRQLADLEVSLGFRSSFNFVPEGSYVAPKELRDELTGQGFEIGVHDLNHDGKLFDSLKGFKAKALRINHHLKEWGAKGFRTGFMLRNLEWHHLLNIQYDLSTFDTDPFEMQSDGVGSIFPFWLPGPPGLGVTKKSRMPDDDEVCPGDRPGYVELPYTLAQDSTLFLVLGETSPEIWLRKLDWIAQHGGMVLVNVHPDYLRFEGESPSRRTFTVDHYVRLLTYVREKYADSFWPALPREVAEYVGSMQRKPLLRAPKRVGMITHSFYENDNRVARYAETLAARGDLVDVFALRRSPDLPVHETLQGVNLFRIQDRFGKKERSKFSYLWPLVRFLAASSKWVTRHHRRRKYDLLHIHNIPDFMVFAAWYPKLTGTPVMLDVHDIVPEFFISKFGKSTKSLLFKMLKWMERVSAGFSDHVIIANHLWLDLYRNRTHTQGRCSAFINNVDSRVFQPGRSAPEEKLIILFPGGLQWHQGLDIAIRAFAKIKDAFPDAEFHIYGDGNAKESLVALVGELHLENRVLFFDPLNVRKIAAIMANATLGVVPKRADSFGNEAYSTKIMEFMSVGVPVIVANTKIDRYYFNDRVVRFFESGNHDALAEAMVEMLGNPRLRTEMAARALEYAAQNCWDTRKVEYLRLVDQLMEKKTAEPAASSSVVSPHPST